MSLVNSTYAGKASYPYVASAMLELESLSNGFLTVRQNEKGTAVLRHGSLSNDLEQAACGWSAVKPVLKDRVIVLQNLMIVNELCKEDYFNDWEAEQMGNSAWRNNPQGLAQWLSARLLSKGMAGLETMIYQGTGVAPQFAGFEKLIADAITAGVAGDTPTNAGSGALTASTIINALSAVVDATSPATKSQSDFSIGLSFNAFEAYIAALGGFGANGLGANGVNSRGTMWYNGEQLTFNGYAVHRMAGASDNTIIASPSSNLQFFTALLSDTTSVRIEEREMEEDVRFKAKFDAAVGVGSFQDVTIWK